MVQVRKGLASKLTAILLALMMAAVFMPQLGSVQKSFADEQVKSAKITILAVKEEYQLEPVLKNITVPADAAVKAGYTVNENYKDEVTIADAIVVLHQQVYGEAFDQNPTKYLTMSNGTIKTFFEKPVGDGKTIADMMFYVNDKYPEYADKPGTGSVADDTVLQDGDTARIFAMFSEYYADNYLLFSMDKDNMLVGDTVTVHVDSFWASSLGQQDPEPMEGVDLSVRNKAGDEVETATTDGSGDAEITVDEVGDYSIVATSIPEDEMFEEDYFISDYKELAVRKVAEPVTVQVTAAVRNFEKPDQFDIVPGKYEVSSDAAESFGDYGDIVYRDNNGVVTLADVLYTLQKEKFGDAFTKETASDYIKITSSGWMTKVFGKDANTSASAINEDLNMVGGAYETVLANGDQFDYWAYQDTTGWSDTFLRFAGKEISVKAGEEFELSVEGIGWGGPAAVSKAKEGDLTAATYDESGALTPVEGAVMGENGKIKMSFEKPGEYNVTASGKIGTVGYSGDEIDAPAVLPWAKVTVTPAVDLSAATVIAKAATFNGKAQEPAVTVKLDGETLDAKSYDVAYQDNIDAGKGKITVTGKNGYFGSAQGTFVINKAAQTIGKVTPLAKTFKAKKKTKKLAKNKKFQLKAKATGDAKVKVSFTKANKVGGKKIIVSKTGKVTVKKGLKKGTYKIKVKVSKAGNKNYNAAKTVMKTVKIKIK